MGLSHRQVFLQSSPSPLKLPEAEIEQSSLENNLKRQRKFSQMMGDHHLPDDVYPKRKKKKSWADASSSTSGGNCSVGGGNHGSPGAAPMAPVTALMQL